jgi:hypothetical protein
MVILGSGAMTAQARLTPAPQTVSSITMRAAQTGDDQRFAVSLANDKVRLVLFLTTPFQWGNSRATSVNATMSDGTLPDAVSAFSLNHPEVALDGTRAGILMGKMPARHCAAAVMNQRIENWSFSGTFRDFEVAFDRMIHHIDVAEGNVIGPPPPPDSPMLANVDVTAQQTTGWDVYLNALSQLDGVVVIFRQAPDRSGEMRCLRETYTRDATVTMFVGFDRNPQLFKK